MQIPVVGLLLEPEPTGGGSPGLEICFDARCDVRLDHSAMSAPF
jgi:hypothetical protein